MTWEIGGVAFYRSEQVLNLGGLLLAVAIILIIAVLAYFRYMSRRHVAPLLRAMIDKLTREGMTTDGVLRATAAKLRRRSPFKLIKEEEMNFFLDVLQDLAAPVDVAAHVWQRFELRFNISSFRERQTLLQLAYLDDLEICVRTLIETAARLHKNAGDKYPNMGIALLAAVSQREGWVFAGELADSVAFKYLRDEVRIAKQSSGKDVARAVLLEELKRRPLSAPEGETYEARRSGKQDFVYNFEAHYEEAFRRIG
jgi:hypothetical protein